MKPARRPGSERRSGTRTEVLQDQRAIPGTGQPERLRSTEMKAFSAGAAKRAGKRRSEGSLLMARKWWTLTAVVAGVFMLLLDVTIVNVALPQIQRAFGASLPDLQWVIDAYALTLAALMVTAGSLAGRFGRRIMFAAGTAVFTAGSLLCGLAIGPLDLALSRAGQGIGGAIMFATSLALISDAFRGKDRGVAFGVFGAVTGVAVAVGPVLGGVITSGLSWRWIFLVNIPIGIATIAVTLVKVAASLSAAGALLAAFVIIEAAQRRPMLDLSLFRVPTFTGGLIAAFGISASVFLLLNYIILYQQDELGLSALGTGLARLVPHHRRVRHRRHRRAAHHRHPGPADDLGRVRTRHRRAAADARADHRIRLDPPHPRIDHRRGRRRADQRAARVHGRRRGRTRAGRHGLRHQLDAAQCRARGRHRRTRRDLHRPAAAHRRGQAGRHAAGRPRPRDSSRDRRPERQRRAVRPVRRSTASRRHSCTGRLRRR